MSPKNKIKLNILRKRLDSLDNILLNVIKKRSDLVKKGFDVLLGNPQWDSVKLEEQKFWARYFPGMRSMSQREYEKEKEN